MRIFYKPNEDSGDTIGCFFNEKIILYVHKLLMGVEDIFKIQLLDAFLPLICFQAMTTCPL